MGVSGNLVVSVLPLTQEGPFTAVQTLPGPSFHTNLGVTVHIKVPVDGAGGAVPCVAEWLYVAALDSPSVENNLDSLTQGLAFQRMSHLQ